MYLLSECKITTFVEYDKKNGVNYCKIIKSRLLAQKYLYNSISAIWLLLG